MPAILDLRECLSHTQQHSDAVRALSAAIEARLLLPGVDTANIIQVYVSAIKALSCLDPSGVKLEAVSERVRAYLKARPDTIRQIVTSLTDPETSELLENTGSEAELLTDDGGADGSLYDAADAEEAKADEATMLAWQPDPIQADPSRPSARRNADVLSRLVNIYGSRALFVNEFRNMLADKLLTASDYDTDREVRMPQMASRRSRSASDCH
jgi:anaphase-promoting complex subunit 2